MLRPFKYVRRKACKSVIAGAEQAVEELEARGYFDKLTARVVDQLQTVVQNAAGAGASEVGNDGLQAEQGRSGEGDSPDPQKSGPRTQAVEQTSKTKPPRLRKRPNRKGSRQ